MDSQAGNKVILKQYEKKVLLPNKNDNHIRSLVTKTIQTYKILGNHNDPDSNNVKIGMTKENSTYWSW